MSDWLKGFLNSTDPTSSLKHAAYATVVCSSICWLTYALIAKGMDASWCAVYTILVGAVTTAKIVSKDEASGPNSKP